MAEISVPAWPMPIHQTKLMMSNAQPTGTLLPQMPMPFARSQTSATLRPMSSMNAIAVIGNHTSGVCFVSTMPVSLSVIEAYVCPDARTGMAL